MFFFLVGTARWLAARAARWSHPPTRTRPGIRLLRRNEPASRAIWAARMLVNVKVLGRTHGGAWDGPWGGTGRP